MTQLLPDGAEDTGVTKGPSPYTLPDTPTGLSASADGAAIDLAWTSAVGKYNVYRNGGYMVTVTEESWTDIALVNGTTYEYTIVSVIDSNPEGFQHSAASSSATVVYQAPTAERPKPVLLSGGDVLTDSNHLVRWSHDRQGDTVNYDVYDGLDDKGDSGVNTTQRAITLPTDGSWRDIIVYFWYNGDLSTKDSVSYRIQTPSLNKIPLTGYSMMALPSSDIPYGSFTKEALGSMMAPASTWYMDGTGDVSVGYASDGNRALIARMRPMTTGSAGTHQIKSAVRLPYTVTGRTPVKVAFDMRLRPGFDFGKDVYKQTAKLGFGLRSTVDSSGGDPEPDGWSIRMVMRGNGDDTADLNVYPYTAEDLNGYPTDLQTNSRLTIGNWIQVVIEVMTNTIGSSNGVLKVWQDASLIANRSNVLYQTSGTPNVDGISFTDFHGGNSPEWAPEDTNYAEFRNVGFKIG